MEYIEGEQPTESGFSGQELAEQLAPEIDEAAGDSEAPEQNTATQETERTLFPAEGGQSGRTVERRGHVPEKLYKNIEASSEPVEVKAAQEATNLVASMVGEAPSEEEGTALRKLLDSAWAQTVGPVQRLRGSSMFDDPELKPNAGIEHASFSYDGEERISVVGQARQQEGADVHSRGLIVTSGDGSASQESGNVRYYWETGEKGREEAKVYAYGEDGTLHPATEDELKEFTNMVRRCAEDLDHR